jgi:hypothetical protein
VLSRSFLEKLGNFRVMEKLGSFQVYTGLLCKMASINWNWSMSNVKCLTSAYNTTSEFPMAMSMASVAKESINTSTAISKSAAAKDTNTLAGCLTGSQAFGSTHKFVPLPMKSKHNSELEPGEVSTMSNASVLYESDEDDLNLGEDDLKLDLDAPRVFEMNHIHELILDTMIKGDNWQRDLETVHRLTEAENCECFSLAGHYLYCDEFPEDAVNEKLFPHALEGWKLLKQNDFLCRKYPKELMDVCCLTKDYNKFVREYCS